MAKLIEPKPTDTKDDIYTMDEVIGKKVNDDNWIKKYRLFLDFIKEHGHQIISRVKLKRAFTTEELVLERWVRKQRKHYMLGKLLDWRYNLLVKADFIFYPDKINRVTRYNEFSEFKKDDSWNKKYRLFLDFIKEHGHQIIPVVKLNRDYTPEELVLGRWVRYQRKQYKLGKLLDWKYNLLVKADFIFNPDKTYRVTRYDELIEIKKNENWFKSYRQFLDYIKKHGHQKIPGGYQKGVYKPEVRALGSWVYYQRKQFMLGKLSDWRYNLLVKAGFIFDPYETDWETKYKELIEFKRINGHCNVLTYNKIHPKPGDPIYTPENDSLGYWVRNQKTMYKLGKLSDWKYKLLVKVDFPFKSNYTNWETKYKELSEFKTINGHFDVSAYDKNHLHLREWLKHQCINKKKLKPEKIKKLDEIGFEWRIRKNTWDKFYKYLYNYYIENGEAYVQNYKKAGFTTNQFYRLNRSYRKQNEFYQNESLSLDKIRLLKEINFDFNLYTNRLDKIWDEKYHRLIEFKKRFGHCNVPHPWKEDKLLSRWVAYNRSHRNKLPPDRYKKLDDMGFTWQFAKVHWEMNILLPLLKKYKEANGHCNVKNTENKPLYNWIMHIRSLKRRNLMGNLTDDNIKELQELGFDWAPLETHWEKYFKEMAEFILKNGHCKVPQKMHPTLYSWVKSNRVNRKKLSAEKISRLDAIGFEWNSDLVYKKRNNINGINQL